MDQFALHNATSFVLVAVNTIWRAACTVATVVPDTLIAWQTRSEQRHAMRLLDDRLMKDMGIEPSDALREANKPFWRA